LRHRPLLAGGITLGNPLATPSHLVGRADEEVAGRLGAASARETVGGSLDRAGPVEASAGEIPGHRVSMTTRMRHAHAESSAMAAPVAQHSLRRDAVPAMAESVVQAISLHQFVFSDIAAPRYTLITDQ
jgi:hypothetical protein